MARLYLSGPVTGIEDDNYDAFHAASVALNDAGFLSTMPHSLVLSGDSHEIAMLVCINSLTDFVWVHGEPLLFYDGLALLPGWEQSEGAKLEKAVAEACGIPVKTVDEWIEEAR